MHTISREVNMKTLFVVSFIVFVVCIFALVPSWIARPDLFGGDPNQPKRRPTISFLKATPEQRKATDKFLADGLVLITKVSFIATVVSFLLVRI